MGLQDYVLKRGFNVAFAGVALLVLLPVIVAAIKLVDGGPILYHCRSQDPLSE